MFSPRFCAIAISLASAFPIFAQQPLKMQVQIATNQAKAGDYRVVSVVGACSASYRGTDHTRPMRAEQDGFSSPLAKFYFYKDRAKKPDFSLMAKGVTWQQNLPVIQPGRRLTDQAPIIWVAGRKKPACVALEGNYRIPNRDNTPGSEWRNMATGTQIELTMKMTVFVDGQRYTQGSWHQQGFANLAIGAELPMDSSINMQDLPEPATADTFIVEQPTITAPTIEPAQADPGHNQRAAELAMLEAKRQAQAAAQEKAAAEKAAAAKAEQQRLANQAKAKAAAKAEAAAAAKAAAAEAEIIAAEQQRRAAEQKRLALLAQQREKEEQQRLITEQKQKAEQERQRIAEQQALAAQKRKAAQQKASDAAERAWAQQRAQAQAQAQKQQAAIELAASKSAAQAAALKLQMQQRNEIALKAGNLAQQRIAIAQVDNTSRITPFGFSNAKIFLYVDKKLAAIQRWPNSALALNVNPGVNSALVKTQFGELRCELNSFEQRLDLQQHCSHPVTLNGIDEKCSYFDVSITNGDNRTGLFNSNKCPQQIYLPNLDTEFEIFAASAKNSWTANLTAKQQSIQLTSNRKKIKATIYRTLPGTRISLLAPNNEIVSNRTASDSGEFSFTLRPWQQQQYRLSLSKPGYNNLNLAISDIDGEITLTPLSTVEQAKPLTLTGTSLLEKHQISIANVFFRGTAGDQEIAGRLIDFDFLPEQFKLTDLEDENAVVAFDKIEQRYNAEQNSIDLSPSRLTAPYQVQLKNKELTQPLNINRLRLQIADQPWQTLTSEFAPAFRIDLARDLNASADVAVNPITLCAEGYLPVTEKEWFFNNTQIDLTPVHPETTLMLLTGTGDDVARYLHRVADSIAQLKLNDEPWLRVGQSYDGIFYPSEDINKASENLPEDANNRLWAEIGDALKGNSKVAANRCGTPKRKVLLFAAGDLHYFIGAEQKLADFLQNHEVKVISNLSFEQAQQQLQAQYHHQLTQLWQEHWYFADNADQIQQTIQKHLNTPATTRKQ